MFGSPMDFISSIVKKQNYDLLLRMCEEYGWDKEKILKKYWTPTFYLVSAQPKPMKP